VAATTYRIQGAEKSMAVRESKKTTTTASDETKWKKAMIVALRNPMRRGDEHRIE
jgi:hypothetical protein